MLASKNLDVKKTQLQIDNSQIVYFSIFVFRVFYTYKVYRRKDKGRDGSDKKKRKKA
jgi:hypothetical protein